MTTTIIFTIVSLTLLGLLLAAILYVVAQKFKVYEDPRIDNVEGILPAANCGGCGYAGCRAFAEACVKAETLDSLYCPVGGNDVMKQVALSLAPEQSFAVRRYLAGPEYSLDVARIMLDELMPREATYFLAKVLAQDPGHADAQALRELASDQLEFADLFWQGCWGGSDKVFESKLAKLKRCLVIRPGDFGVCMQMVFVCFEMGRPDDAADAIAGFIPSNPADHYRWAWYTFQSHLAARRLPEAISAARLCLQLDPSDADAREFLRQAHALP